MGVQNKTHDEINGEVNGMIQDYSNKDFNKGNEERKIFCGGISYETTNDDLMNYFSQYGEVSQAQVKFDRVTGRSRGFAFVEFATPEACKLALVQREQQIKNKQCEIKPAKTRENNIANKKVFVGGLPADFPEEDLRKHFEQFGKVDEIEWPFDKQTKARRNFAFVVFDEEDGADRASTTAKQLFGSRECDVKKAVPQNKRNKILPSAHMALRGAFGVHGGMRGTSIIANTPQWFGAWSQMGATGLPTAYATNATGAWGDWYGNAAAAANYYNANNAAAGYANPYAVGVPNGIAGNMDYSQANISTSTMGRQGHQNGLSINGVPRYQQPHQQY